MADVEIKYNNATIASLNDSGAEVLETNGTYLTDDITVEYTKPSAPTPTLQSKSVSYIPTTSQQTASVTADAGYDGLSAVNVTVNAMPSGTAGTPTATKGTVSNHSVSVTPSVTNTTGYITGGTKSGTAVTVSASELVSGTKSITSSGTTDVTNYASASVSAGTEGTPTATKSAVNNHSVTVTPSVTNTGGFISGTTKTGTAVTVTAAELESGTKSITENGTGISVSGYSAVDVSVPSQAPTGVKYVYTDVDGIGAWDVSGYAKCSYDYAPLRDNKYRLWVKVNSTVGMTVMTKIYARANKVVIDWGDGTQSYAVASPYQNTHTYTEAGIYCIECTDSTNNRMRPRGYAMGQSGSTPDELLVGVELYATNSDMYEQSSFDNCQALKRVTIINGELNSYFFQDCVSLEDCDLGSVTSLPSFCFCGCSKLSKINIPATVETISINCFADCTNLKEVHLLPASPPTLDNSAFTNISSNCEFYVPSSSLSAYQSATNWSVYASQMVGE